jgi:phage FluMu gp28-like protein
MWDESYIVKPNHEKFWLASEDARKDEIMHGVDIAKKMDYTVFYSVNTRGQLVGFCRFQHVSYPQQVIRLKTYLTSYFAQAENTVKFDATGVGVSFEDMLEEAQLEASLYPVSFSSKSKSEMITKAVMAIQSGWHKAPRLKCIAHEFAIYELSVTSTGLHKYGAPEGEHDDVVSAAILAISGSYVNSSSADNEKLLEAALNGESLDDIIGAYSAVLEEGENVFVTEEDYEEGEVEIDFEND